MLSTQGMGSSKVYLVSLFSIAAILVATAVIIAIFFRPGPFRVIAEGQGTRIEFDFQNSQVDLNELLNKVLQRANGGSDADRRLVMSILRAHDFYLVPSVDAVHAIQNNTETHDEVARAVRKMLYNLEGPFARPKTFLDAPDDRLLMAMNDLYAQKPESPIIKTLWELSLDFKGIFKLRDIPVSVRRDNSLSKGKAATCAGNIWLDRVALINIAGAEGRAIGPHFTIAKACEGLHVWLAPSDIDLLIGNHHASQLGSDETTGAAVGNGANNNYEELSAILTPLPKRLEPTGAPTQ